METQSSQNSSQNTEVRAALASNSEIPVGASVIYGLHGKCTVASVETREVAGQAQRFYKLEVQKSTFSRTSRQEPAIWVPVSSAKNRGIRAPMTSEDIEQAYAIFSSREYYLPINESWNLSQSKMEAMIRNEGSLGIAKALSFLCVLKKKQVVPTPEVNRTNETLQRQFAKEVADLTGDTIKSVEEKIAKLMKNKLLPDA